MGSNLSSVWKISQPFLLKKFPFLFSVFFPSGILLRCDLELVIVAFTNLNLSITSSVSLPPATHSVQFFFPVLSSSSLISLCCVSFVVYSTCCISNSNSNFIPQVLLGYFSDTLSYFDGLLLLVDFGNSNIIFS